MLGHNFWHAKTTILKIKAQSRAMQAAVLIKPIPIKAICLAASLSSLI
jgi:hypothetical protein